MSALHIVSGNAAQTGAVTFAGTGTTHWSAAFEYRVNTQPATGLMYGGFSMLGDQTNIRINPTVSGPHLYISLQCGAGYLFWDQPIAIGQIVHVAFAYDGTPTTGSARIDINGITVATLANPGASAIAGTHTAGFAPYDGSDLSVGNFGLWSGYTLTTGDTASLASGTSPGALSTPATAYYSFAGTSGTAAHVGDAGVANLGSAGSSYNLATVRANYSSDSLAAVPLVQCSEAFVSNLSGGLILFWLYSAYESFRMSGDNGFYNLNLLFISMTSGGSGYSQNPTATFSGGSPSRAPVAGTPIVVGGQIVGVPIWDAGDGIAATGLTISFSDSTGSGAVGVPIVGGQPLPVHTVGSPPVVKVNGSVATLNSLDTFKMIDRSPFVAYQFQTPVTAGQAVTYTLSAGWATTSGFGASVASATDVVANNYAGAKHEPRFVLPPSVNMRQGVNHVSGAYSNYACGSIGQDISKRFNHNNLPVSTTWPTTAGIGSWVIGGNDAGLPLPAGPSVIFVGDGTSAIATCMIGAGGVIQSVSMVSSSSNWTHATVYFIGGGGGGGAAGTATIVGGAITGVVLSSGGQGYCDGLYYTQWDDRAPIGTGPYTPSTVLSLSESSSGGPYLYVTPIASLSSAGTLVSGVLVGVTKAYYVQYRPTAAYDYVTAAIGMTFSGGTGTGPYTNTAFNAGGNKTWVCVPPQNVINRSNLTEPDGAMNSLLKFSPGNNVGTIRYMDCALPTGGGSMARNPQDITQLADLSWNLPYTYPNAPVAAIRPYNHSVSPYLYVDSNYPGSTFTSGGQPSQYRIPMVSDGWLNPFADPTTAVMEFVTSVPHGFGSFQEYNNNIAQPNYIAVTNGQVGAVHNPPTTTTLAGFQGSMYSTGTNSFIAQYGSSTNNGTTMPGNINNAAYTQGVTGGISNNSVVSLAVGAAGTSYVNGTTVPAIAPPAGAWQTALATAATSGGSVSSITPVSGHGGNNYALAPLVTIQPPSGSYAQATVAFNLVGGVISNLTLAYGGLGYTGSVNLYVWGGGSGSGFAATATVAGGKVTGFTGVTGGSGFTYPLRVIVPPPSAIATAHATISGGSVATLVLDTGGSSYPAGFVPWVMVDAPSQQAILTPTLTTGSLSGLTVTYGGLGHVAAPEIVILGNGINAAATAVLTGTVVTGTTGLVGGSGYTGTNPIAVGVAPPARQAIGTLVVSGGGIQSGSIVDPGCGYPNTPPAVSVVGAGSGGTVTAAMTFPFFINVPTDTKDTATIPYELAGGVHADLPGSGSWINIPMAATDALADAMVASTAAYLPAGQAIWLEYVNEHWNQGFAFRNYLTYLGYVLSSSLGTSNGDQDYHLDALYAANAAARHARAEAYLASVGRPNDLVRMFGSFAGSSQTTANMVAWANQTSTRIDAVCIGPYWQISEVDACLTNAAASVIADLPQSVAHGTAYATTWRWSMDMYMDLLRNLIISDASFVGSGTGGAPSGYFAAHQVALSAYNLVPGQTSPPVLVGYESAVSKWVPNDVAPGYTMSIATRPYNATSMLQLDLLQHPGMYDAGLAFFLMQDAGGLAVSNYFQMQGAIFLPNSPLGQNPWTILMYEGQQPCYADGSDGKATPLYWMNANTVPGAGSTAAAYTTFFPKYNGSPLMQAFIDFGALAGSPVPTLTVSPTSMTVPLGGTHAVTATLSNSSAALTASAIHGTTSAVTSGIPFTYTAPGSGTTDTVTVVDSTDGLTAPVAVTLTTPTPTPTSEAAILLIM